MKIVHAADLHVDSPLSGLCSYPGAPLGDVRAATRVALRALVDLCVLEEARLLLIAGDLYDGDFRDYATALFFTEQMARLRAADTEVVWIRGNHDAANRITRELRLASHVHELSHEAPQSRIYENLGIAIHGQGYGTRDVTNNLARTYPARVPDLLNVGMLHTALDGREGHAAYAPCSISDLKSKEYDYWALGHVHTREVICEAPWIVFPGNLQGRHIREVGPKGATLIHVESGRIAKVEDRTLATVRWELTEVDVTLAKNLDDVLDCVTLELAQRRASIGSEILCTRVHLVGATAAHAEICSGRARVESELRGYAVDSGNVYLEQVKFQTTGARSAIALASRLDALGDLFRDIDALGGDDTARELLQNGVMRPLAALPGDLLAEQKGDFASILREARHLLEGQLLQSPGDEG